MTAWWMVTTLFFQQSLDFVMEPIQFTRANLFNANKLNPHVEIPNVFLQLVDITCWKVGVVSSEESIIVCT